MKILAETLYKAGNFEPESAYAPCEPKKSYRKPLVTSKFWRIFTSSTNHREKNIDEGSSKRLQN
jgi:hypothetical protein